MDFGGEGAESPRLSQMFSQHFDGQDDVAPDDSARGESWKETLVSSGRRRVY